MFALCFIPAAAVQFKKPSTGSIRLIRAGLLALVAIFAASSLAEAGGFGHGGSFGGSSGGSKNFAQNFMKSQTTKKPTSGTNKTIKLAQNDMPQKMSMGDKPSKMSMGKMEYGKCHEKCHCHYYSCYDYPSWYCGWEYSDGIDLQLMSVRMLDGGNAEEKAGPTFRVWFRNNSSVAISRPFSLTAMVARDSSIVPGLPQAGVRVGTIGAGQMMSVDIRMPIEANQPGFPMLQVMVDSHREIAEVNKSNNSMMIARTEIEPVTVAPKTETPPAPPETPEAPAPEVKTDPAVQAEISNEPVAEEEEG